VNDIEKVIKSLEYCIKQTGCYSDSYECPWVAECRKNDNSLDNACLTLLKEQNEREKQICKNICEFIKAPENPGTDVDKEYVCHIVQRMFLESR